MNLITKMIGFGASTVALMLLIVVLAYSNMSQMSGALSTIGEGFMPLNNAMSAVSKGQLSQSAWLERSLLAAELDISRTPVREALLRLEKEGVLRVANSGGFRLVEITEEETLELYQARAAIEGQAARILAARKDIAELEQDQSDRNTRGNAKGEGHQIGFFNFFFDIANCSRR